jgi:bifunctional oligoribonuclease and PAP phosphatase NrnA
MLFRLSLPSEDIPDNRGNGGEEMMAELVRTPTLKDLAGQILRARSILLTTHSGPDGDGIGSLIALGQALEEHGCSVTRLLPDPLPARYRFLDPHGRVQSFGPSCDEWIDAPCDLTLILDTHHWAMLDRLGDWLRQRDVPTVFLDHHPQRPPLRPEVHADSDAVATGELVFRLLRHHLGFSISPEVAEALYVSLSFDTNSFKYIRSNPASLIIAADLITRGVDTNKVYRHLFASNSRSKARLLGWVLSSVQFECEGRLAYVLLPHSVLGDLHLERDELRDSITHILEIQGVEVAVTVKETEPGQVNVSLRSKGKCSVNGVAALMGGGGHSLAAGCDGAGTVDQVWSSLRGPLLHALECI